ncbi:MAG: hypothetical protein L3J33_04840 [Rhodobacteraceae bacterium]|nr:hypothetical protein [Paracoccaceae bacterium]
MTYTTRRKLFAFAIAAVCAVSTPIKAQDTTLRGPVILTISGDVDAASRGAVTEDYDKFFVFNEVEFQSAAQFDFAALKSLDTVTITTDFPMGGEMHEFEGPTLASVLDAAGIHANDDSLVTMRALDGYAIEVSYKELIDAGAVVAYRRDGAFFAIGDFGPTKIVFPRSDRADLAEMNDDWWIWSIYHINVE